MNNITDYMIEAANIGFYVFPLKSRSKVPAIDRWTNNYTRDINYIEHAMRGHDDANYAIVTGVWSDSRYAIGVIDIDDKSAVYGADGYERLEQWERKYGHLPETACVKTGSGGQHIFYLFDVDKLPKGYVNADIGIDFKAQGGYVVGSGSTHKCGNLYMWDLHPEDVPIAHATKSVFDFIEWCRPLSGGSETSFALPDVVLSGSRNNTMWSYVCQLQSQGYTDDEIATMANDANRNRCQPPLAQRTIDSMVDRATVNYPKGERREYIKSNGIGTLHAAWCACMHVPYDGEIEKEQDSEPAAEEAPSTSTKLTTLDKARLVMREHHICKLDGAPSAWNGQSYDMGWFAVEKAIHFHFPALKRTERQEILAFIELEITNKDVADTRFIAFQNGVLDILTMDFVPPSERFLIPNTIPHNWNPNARNKAALTAIKKCACNDEEIERALLETAGLCLYRGREFAKCPILYGEGSNGKSTYLNILKKMVGRDNYSVLELQELSSKFSTSLMAGKLANIGDDVSADYFNTSRSSIYKKLVSGEEVKAEEKGKTPYFFRPYCTLVFSLNELPRIEDNSYGFYRRFQPIPFNYDSRIDPDKNVNIEREACAEESLEMLIVEAVKALRAAIERSELTIPSVTKAKVEEVRIDNNSVLAFIAEHKDTMEHDYYEHATSILYDDYVSWCKQSGYRSPYKRKGVTEIINKEMGWTTTRMREVNKREYFFVAEDKGR